MAPAVALCLAMGLAGCQTAAPGDGASRAGGGLDLLGAGASRVIERDVEAPEVFSMEEAGLWDGRPSLGGVWVAHPGARDPERVLIRNGQTGATVIGALFRRERENPGPRFQISSEAANALGILPGQPTTIAVTALRLERIETEPRPEAAVEAPVEAPVPMADAGAQAGVEPVAATAAAPVGGAVETVAITAVDPEPAPRRGLFAGLFGRSSPPADAQAPNETAITETSLAPTAAAGTMPAPAGTSSAQTPMVDADAGRSADDAQPQPRRGLFAGLFGRRTPPEPERAEPVMIPMPEPAMAQTASLSAPAGAPAGASPLERPFVQIGIFSIESNAHNAQRQMQEAGLTAEIRRGRLNDREFWRVVVGPAADAGTRRQTLERVRGLGFADAYAVVR